MTAPHDPTGNGIHACPFPETGCTARACHGRTRLSVAAVHAAARQVAARIHPDPLAGAVASVTIPPMRALLASAIAPAPQTLPWEAAKSDARADLAEAVRRAVEEPYRWRPQPYVMHPRHYEQARRDGCMCVLGMCPCPWHTAVKVRDSVEWIGHPLGGAEAWPRDGWTVSAVWNYEGKDRTDYDLHHPGTDKRVVGASRDQFRLSQAAP